MRSFLFHRIIDVGGNLLVNTPKLFEKSFSFWVVLSVPHSFDGQLCQKYDERDRNFMCKRTLPSFLVNTKESNVSCLNDCFAKQILYQGKTVTFATPSLSSFNYGELRFDFRPVTRKKN